MHAKTFAALLFVTLLAGCEKEYVRPIALVPERARPAPINLKDRAPRMTTLHSLNYDIPIGTHIGQFGIGYNFSVKQCKDLQPLTYTTGTAKSDTRRYDTVFREVMDGIGVPVQQTLQRFEGEEIKKADLQVAATIKDMALNICYPKAWEDKDFATGQAEVTIDWAVFSPIEKKVVYSAVTTGKTSPYLETRLGEHGIVREAFRDALSALTAKTEFADIVASGKAPAAASTAAISLVQPVASTGDIHKNLSSIRQAVVTIQSNAGEGSGFAVGDGTYVLTAAHGVSGREEVKMIAADGTVHYGTVVRTNPARDVALIKLTKGRLLPMHVSRATVRAGEDAYAVGSPLGGKFAFSVTRGVISGFPKLEERAFIQSDVQVLPGSSGGPLIDARGNVIGMTSWGVDIAGAPSGMNFFVPASELFGALSISARDK